MRAGTAVAGMVGGLALLVAQGVTPAGAQEERGPIVPHFAPVSPEAPLMPSPGDRVVAGDFAGDERDELLYYSAGNAPDSLVSFDNGGTSGEPLTWHVYRHSVTGNYTPVVGDFYGDGYDDILWYGYGSAPDYLWRFTDFDTVASTTLEVNGTYLPFAGDFNGDGVDDIFWYGPGSAPDYRWKSEPDVSRYTTERMYVTGYYQPVVGSFGLFPTEDDVLWYGPGPDPDYLWDFVAEPYPDVYAYYSHEMPVDGYYAPVSVDEWNDGMLGDDIVWVTQGLDPVWDFRDAALRRWRDLYDSDETGRATAADLFGDGYEDIVWTAPWQGTAVVWDHAADPDTSTQLDRWTYRMRTVSSAPGSTQGTHPDR